MVVQRNTYTLPAVPVKLDVGLLALPNVPPVPLTTVHRPVPTVGVLPAKVTCVVPQAGAWSEPAAAAVGFSPKVTVISSLEVHEPLVVVQRNTYTLPAVPVKLEVGLLALPNVPPVPLTTVHKPVPTVGVLANKLT